MRHSYSSFRMQCPRNFSILSFNVAITVLLVFAVFNTVAFATRSLYDIFKIRFRNHISAASRFLWSSGVVVPNPNPIKLCSMYLINLRVGSFRYYRVW